MITRYALVGFALGVVCIVIGLFIGWNPLATGTVEDAIAGYVPFLGAFAAAGALIGWYLKRSGSRRP